MSRSCATCSHWRPPTERSGYGNALSIRRIYPSEDYEAAYQREQEVDRMFGECKAILLQDEMTTADPIPLATVRDGSDYMAVLYTRAEFGCAMWSERDESRPHPEG